MCLECLRMSKNKIFSLKENRCSFVLSNTAQRTVDKLKIDGCVINDTSERCDWAIIDLETSTEFYIELKGSDVCKAYNQIECTVNRLTSDRNKEKLGIIVHNKNPSTDSEQMVYKKKARRAKIKLLTGGPVLKATIDDLLKKVG